MRQQDEDGIDNRGVVRDDRAGQRAGFIVIIIRP